MAHRWVGVGVQPGGVGGGARKRWADGTGRRTGLGFVGV